MQENIESLQENIFVFGQSIQMRPLKANLCSHWLVLGNIANVSISTTQKFNLLGILMN